MRFAAAMRRERLLPVDMTPMIDIVFQLLIFFLATTELARSTRVLVELPKESGRDAIAGDDGIEVVLAANGAILLAGGPIPAEGLVAGLQALAAERKEGPVVIRADRRAAAEDLNRLVAAVREAGGGSVRLAVSPPGGRN